MNLIDKRILRNSTPQNKTKTPKEEKTSLLNQEKKISDLAVYT